ncbi:hypothetical protein Tco_0269211 [Tanacetum coccineum]
MQLPSKKENQDKYCDYHGEKGHYANDCFQLRIQLEIALELGKLNHLIKDVRQRGRGNTKRRDAGKDKVINMIRSWLDDRKRKSIERDEIWMKAPISIRRPGSVCGGDVRALLREHEPRYEVTPKEHSYRLGRLRRWRGETVGKNQVGSGLRRWRLFKRVMINFTVVQDPSPYNVILGRTSLRTLRAVSSTIHSMVKFPTLRGVATQVTRTMIISECRRLEKKQMIKKETNQSTLQEEEKPERVNLTKQILVNPSYPDQLVTIGGNLSEGCKDQLKALLKKGMDVFA